MSQSKRSNWLHRVLLANMALGMLVFAVMIYFIITGEYSSLAARVQAEHMYNMVGIGSLIYAVLAWYTDLLIRPHAMHHSQ